mmetsp:Transcript_57327/g.136259  ORF Transcript_57327/g.136259 Transcript_57327/m.136259 type:complete len:212 (+) Transcript_57327:74-709(+)
MGCSNSSSGSGGGASSGSGSGAAGAAAPDGSVKVALSLAFKDNGEATGEVIVTVHPDWAENGARRFLELVDDGYFDDCRIYRVVPGFMAQWGINGDLAKYSKWKDSKIPDDSVKQKNLRGRVSFATSGPNCRSCQVFINLVDNLALDKQGFSPIGEITAGMDQVDKIYSGYGESKPKGNAPNQSELKERGDAYLKDFPKLTAIQKASRVEG